MPVEPGVSKACHYASVITTILLLVVGAPMFIAGTVVISLGGSETEHRRYLFLVGLIVMLIGILLLTAGVILIIILCCTDYLNTERRTPTPEPKRKKEHKKMNGVGKSTPRTIIIPAYKMTKRDHHKQKESSASTDLTYSDTPKSNKVTQHEASTMTEGNRAPRSQVFMATTTVSHYKGQGHRKGNKASTPRQTAHSRASPSLAKMIWDREYLDGRNTPSVYGRSEVRHSAPNPRRTYRQKVNSEYTPSFSQNPSRTGSPSSLKKSRKWIPAPRKIPYFWDSAPFHTTSSKL